jgi:hypothetical protein
MDEQQPAKQPQQSGQTTGPSNATPPPVTDDYYSQLRKGKQDFDPKTAEALLMQVNMETDSRAKMQTPGQKHISLASALIFPWRLFDPAAPSSARRIAFVLIFVVILVIAGYMMPSFIR